MAPRAPIWQDHVSDVGEPEGMPVKSRLFPSLLGAAWLVAVACVGAGATAAEHRQQAALPGVSEAAITLGRDLDGDGDPDEIDIRLEVVQIQQEVYPGQIETFWVFAPEGQGMAIPRAPSPTIRVEEGDRVRVTLLNTHYFPHTIHLHGTIHPNAMDGVPDITQAPVNPGESFAYEFIAKNPGTHFYHCHVQPDVHVLMGMVGMLIIEPNRPDNHFTHLVPGAGRIPDLAKAAVEKYQREYSLVYMDIDDRLNRLAYAYSDPREIEKRMHRDYDSTQRKPNVFMLNGRSFPYTLRDSPITVKSGERVKLRVLNAGARRLSLHTHGHHPIPTHVDGYPVPEAMRQARDVFNIGPGRRLDLELRPGSDDKYASGPGVWLMHDHVEEHVTNKGIAPGGDITAIVYDEFIGPDGMPKTATSLEKYFDPAYYRGEIPVSDPRIFGSTRADYDHRRAEVRPKGGKFQIPRRDPGTFSEKLEDPLDDHVTIATSCKNPKGFRRVHVKAGIRFARPGEVYGFEPRQLRVGRCETVEVVFENTDRVRHAFMLPGLNPMLMMEFAGPGTRTQRFVTPDADVTLEYHCHVPSHETMGMLGALIVGAGGPSADPHHPVTAGGIVHHHEPHHGDQHVRRSPVAEPKPRPKHLHVGFGVVVSVDLRSGRLVVDHEEIEGFMAPMVMNYQVVPAKQLIGLKPKDRIRFTIDSRKRAIVDVKPRRPAK